MSNPPRHFSPRGDTLPLLEFRDIFDDDYQAEIISLFILKRRDKG
jgi:hypothetical protein